MMMKKEVGIIILLIAVLFISSCNSDKNIQSIDDPKSNLTASDGSPDLITGSDLNSGLDNNNLNSINDPTLDPNSLGWK